MRRHISVFALAAAATALTVIASPMAIAADFPSKPIRIIVPYGAGDALDASTRVVAEQMKQVLGVPVIVQNIAGAGGSKGLGEGRKADPNGYTIIMTGTGSLTGRPLMTDPGYKTEDFVALGQLSEIPLAIAVKPDSPFRTVGDIVAAAKKGDVTYSTPGAGATQHINMSVFANKIGVKLTHVSGKGGKGAMVKALSGEVGFSYVGAPVYSAMAKAGKIRVITVSSPKRLDWLPDTPTFKESGYDHLGSVWFGMIAPKGVPEPVLAKLRDAIKTAASSKKSQDLYRKMNLVPAYLDADAFAKVIAGSVANYKVVLGELGMLKK